MKELLVCDQWPLRLAEGEGGYYAYANSRSGEVGRNAWCIRWLLHELGLPTGLTAVEPFGGVGAFATVVQGVLRPRHHFIGEIDPDCLRQLQTAFGDRDGMYVLGLDAREAIGNVPGEFYLLDFPFFTLTRQDEWEEQLDRLFLKMGPQAVIWMDGASFGMQWHAGRYAARFGRPVTNCEDSTTAMSHAVAHHTIDKPFAHTWHHPAGPSAPVCELGRRRENGFGGTDALAMNAITRVEGWLDAMRDDLPLLVAEGDRLANDRFFSFCEGLGDLTVVHLAVSPETARLRAAQRGSSQDESWWRGRMTKVERLAERWSDWRLDGTLPPDVLGARLREHATLAVLNEKGSP
jgi:hypothetical protein